jgi:hypothetical protein
VNATIFIIILSQNVWYAIKNLLTTLQKKDDFVLSLALTKTDMKRDLRFASFVITNSWQWDGEKTVFFAVKYALNLLGIDLKYKLAKAIVVS